MRKILFLLIIAGLCFASCNKEPRPLTKQEIQQRADSITNMRMKELDEMSERDLQHRIKIEVKIKVDSMLDAEKAQHAKDGATLNPASKAKDTTASKINAPK